RDRPRERPLGAHHGAARPRPLHERLRSDLDLPPRTAPAAAQAPAGAADSTSALEGQGRWIWYLSQSNGGSIPAIAARAHAAGVSTLLVKSSDGSSNYWSQFSP